MSTPANKLPDKKCIQYPDPYTIKLANDTSKKIKIINAYKDGLTSEIRKSIEKTVEHHWIELESELQDQHKPA